jgi:cysteine desulfuration protein SufE
MAAYPPPLAEIIAFFQDLPEGEIRENLVAYAAAAAGCAPADGEAFDVADVRHDRECTDTVGVFLRVDAATRGVSFRVTLGPKVQTLTRALATILCRGMEGATPEAVIALPADFVPKIVGAHLVRLRSQTVYYVHRRMQEACRTWLERERGAAAPFS